MKRGSSPAALPAAGTDPGDPEHEDGEAPKKQRVQNEVNGGKGTPKPLPPTPHQRQAAKVAEKLILQALNGGPRHPPAEPPPAPTGEHPIGLGDFSDECSLTVGLPKGDGICLPYESMYGYEKDGRILRARQELAQQVREQLRDRQQLRNFKPDVRPGMDQVDMVLELPCMEGAHVAVNCRPAGTHRSGRLSSSGSKVQCDQCLAEVEAKRRQLAAGTPGTEEEEEEEDWDEVAALRRASLARTKFVNHCCGPAEGQRHHADVLELVDVRLSLRELCALVSYPVDASLWFCIYCRSKTDEDPPPVYTCATCAAAFHRACYKKYARQEVGEGPGWQCASCCAGGQGAVPAAGGGVPGARNGAREAPAAAAPHHSPQQQQQQLPPPPHAGEEDDDIDHFMDMPISSSGSELSSSSSSSGNEGDGGQEERHVVRPRGSVPPAGARAAAATKAITNPTTGAATGAGCKAAPRNSKPQEGGASPTDQSGQQRPRKRVRFAVEGGPGTGEPAAGNGEVAQGRAMSGAGRLRGRHRPGPFLLGGGQGSVPVPVPFKQQQQQQQEEVLSDSSEERAAARFVRRPWGPQSPASQGGGAGRAADSVEQKPQQLLTAEQERGTGGEPLKGPLTGAMSPLQQQQQQQAPGFGSLGASGGLVRSPQPRPASLKTIVPATQPAPNKARLAAEGRKAAAGTPGSAGTPAAMRGDDLQGEGRSRSLAQRGKLTDPRPSKHPTSAAGPHLTTSEAAAAGDEPTPAPRLLSPAAAAAAASAAAVAALLQKRAGHMGEVQRLAAAPAAAPTSSAMGAAGAASSFGGGAAGDAMPAQAGGRQAVTLQPSPVVSRQQKKVQGERKAGRKRAGAAAGQPPSPGHLVTGDSTPQPAIYKQKGSHNSIAACAAGGGVPGARAPPVKPATTAQGSKEAAAAAANNSRYLQRLQLPEAAGAGFEMDGFMEAPISSGGDADLTHSSRKGEDRDHCGYEEQEVISPRSRVPPAAAVAGSAAGTATPTSPNTAAAAAAAAAAAGGGSRGYAAALECLRQVKVHVNQSPSKTSPLGAAAASSSAGGAQHHTPSPTDLPATAAGASRRGVAPLLPLQAPRRSEAPHGGVAGAGKKAAPGPSQLQGGGARPADRAGQQREGEGVGFAAEGSHGSSMPAARQGKTAARGVKSAAGRVPGPRHPAPSRLVGDQGHAPAAVRSKQQQTQQQQQQITDSDEERVPLFLRSRDGAKSPVGQGGGSARAAAASPKQEQPVQQQPPPAQPANTTTGGLPEGLLKDHHRISQQQQAPGVGAATTGSGPAGGANPGQGGGGQPPLLQLQEVKFEEGIGINGPTAPVPFLQPVSAAPTVAGVTQPLAANAHQVQQQGGPGMAPAGGPQGSSPGSAARSRAAALAQLVAAQQWEQQQQAATMLQQLVGMAERTPEQQAQVVRLLATYHTNLPEALVDAALAAVGSPLPAAAASPQHQQQQRQWEQDQGWGVAATEGSGHLPHGVLHPGGFLAALPQAAAGPHIATPATAPAPPASPSASAAAVVPGQHVAHAAGGLFGGPVIATPPSAAGRTREALAAAGDDGGAADSSPGAAALQTALRALQQRAQADPVAELQELVSKRGRTQYEKQYMLSLLQAHTATLPVELIMQVLALCDALPRGRATAAAAAAGGGGSGGRRRPAAAGAGSMPWQGNSSSPRSAAGTPTSGRSRKAPGSDSPGSVSKRGRVHRHRQAPALGSSPLGKASQPADSTLFPASEQGDDAEWMAQVSSDSQEQNSDLDVPPHQQLLEQPASQPRRRGTQGGVEAGPALQYLAAGMQQPQPVGPLPLQPPAATAPTAPSAFAALLALAEAAEEGYELDSGDPPMGLSGGGGGGGGALGS